MRHGHPFMRLTCYITAFFAILALYQPASATPSADDYGVIINLAGKQRMLTQKMSKESLLIALDVDKAQNADNLLKTANLFDKTLKGLKDGDSDLGLPPTEDPAIRQQLGVVESLWQAFYPVMKSIAESQSVNDTQLSQLSEKNVPLLKEMNKAVGMYTVDAQKSGLKTNPELANVINLSGRQRMLSQKMAKEFFTIALGHNTEDYKILLVDTYELFDKTMTGLISGDDDLGLPATTDSEILKQLDVVDGLWQEFRVAIEEGASFGSDTISRDDIELVAAQNLPLLVEMNKAVGMFEKLAK